MTLKKNRNRKTKNRKSAPPRSTKHEEKYQREEKLKQSLFQLFCRIDDIKNNTEYC